MSIFELWEDPNPNAKMKYSPRYGHTAPGGKLLEAFLALGHTVTTWRPDEIVWYGKCTTCNQLLIVSAQGKLILMCDDTECGSHGECIPLPPKPPKPPRR